MTSPLVVPTGADRSTVLRNVLLVIVAAAGPLAIAVLRAVLPYGTNDTSAQVVGQIATHPAAESMVLWLSYLALLTLPIGLLLTGRAAMRARPVFGTVAASVAWLGFMSLFAAVVASDYTAEAATRSGIPNSTTTALLDAMAAHPATAVAADVFVVGHILGGILLGIALWRAIPAWAALALIVSQPLHLLFAVVMPNHLLDGLAWVLLAVGFAAVQVRRNAGAATLVGPEDQPLLAAQPHSR